VVTLRSDAGIAVLWATVLINVLLMGAVGVGAFGTAVASRAQAAAIADLAAIAAVQGAGCSSAGDLAQSNGMSVTSCTHEGGDVTVEVVAPAPGLLVRLAELLGQPPPVIRAAASASVGPVAGVDPR
jgi:hypothetical protein